MKVLITGASGLVGSGLTDKLLERGDTVYKLSRSEPETEHDIQWDPYDGFSSDEASKLEGMDIVVHLAGENVAGGSWTEERKARIRDSRVKGTKTLVSALAKTKESPGLFIGASAIGFYGNRENEIVTEDSDAGKGFLSETCTEWEKESEKASVFSERVVITRIGLVLSKDGGALEKMLMPFKLGLGGAVGGGEQWMSWIAIDDLLSVILYAIDNEEISGVLNATSPNPVRNKEFTEALASVLNRPAFIPVPGFGVKLIFGEMGQSLLLDGCRVIPRRLEQKGFKFEFPDLEVALRHVLAE